MSRVAGRKAFQFRKWVYDYPELMGCSVFTSFAMVIWGCVIYKNHKAGPMLAANKRYYTVVRDTDVNPTYPKEFYN